MKSVRAFSLPTVIVVCILICLLLLFTISLFDFNNLYYSYYRRMNQQRDDINSIFVLYCNDSTFLSEVDEKGSFRLYDDRPQTAVTVEAGKWGLYECVKVRTVDGGYASARLFGRASDCDYEAAVWVCNKGSVLSLGGDVEVKGNSYFPMGYINYVKTGDHSFQGEEISGSYINPSGAELPEVISTYARLKEKYTRDITELPSIETEKEQTRYSFLEKEVHFHVPDGYTDFSVSGQVVLHGDRVTLSAGSRLNDVILMARRVTVEEGFRGSLQIIATDTVIIGKKSHLCYPSGVYLKGNNCKSYLQMDEGSSLDGYAVVEDMEKKEASDSKIYVNCKQAADAVFNGLLYVGGVADLRGKCYGGIYLKECCYSSPSSDKTYASTICNAKLYRNVQIGFPFFFKQSDYTRREMKKLY